MLGKHRYGIVRKGNPGGEVTAKAVQERPGLWQSKQEPAQVHHWKHRLERRIPEAPVHEAGKDAALRYAGGASRFQDAAKNALSKPIRAQSPATPHYVRELNLLMCKEIKRESSAHRSLSGTQRGPYSQVPPHAQSSESCPRSRASSS